jgi:hypothetical protein
MKLEQIKKEVEKKVALKSNEWENTVTEFKEEIKSWGTKPEDVEKLLVNKIFQTYKKQLMGNGEVYEGIVLGIGDVTDYGATKLYDKIIKRWELGDEAIRHSMIINGEISSDKEPLWCKENTKAVWKYERDGILKSEKDRIIDLKREKQKPIIGIFKKTDNGDETYHKTTIVLNGDRTDIEIPRYKLVRIQLTGKMNEETGAYYLYANKDSEFVVIKEEELSYNEYSNLINQYYKDETIDFEIAEDIPKLSNLSDKRFCFLKNAIVISWFSQEDKTKSNIMSIGSPQFGFDEESSITCWVPQYENEPMEGYGQVIVCGNPSSNLDGKLFLNCMGIFNSIKIEKPKPIIPEVKKENIEQIQPENKQVW